MALDAVLRVLVDPSGAIIGARAVNSALTGIRATAATIRTSISSNLSALRHTLFSIKGLLLGLGVAAVSRSFLEAAKTTEGYRIRLKTLLGDTAEGNRLFNQMSEYASTVAFQFEEIMGAATRLATVMSGGVNEISQWIPLIGDLAAAFGLDIQTTTDQVARMFSAGAGAADIFRERGVTAMLGLNDGVKRSTEDIKRVLWNAWNDAGSRFRGAASEMANTWVGLMSMFSDRWFTFRNLVMNSGPFDFLKASFNTLLQFIDARWGGIEVLAERMGQSLITTFKALIVGTAGVAEALGQPLAVIWSAVTTMWSNFIGLPDWVRTVGIVGAFLGGKRFLVYFALVLAATSQLKEHLSGLSSAAGEVAQIGDAFYEVFTRLPEFIGEKASAAVGKVIAFLDSVSLAVLKFRQKYLFGDDQEGIDALQRALATNPQSSSFVGPPAPSVSQQFLSAFPEGIPKPDVASEASVALDALIQKMQSFGSTSEEALKPLTSLITVSNPFEGLTDGAKRLVKELETAAIAARELDKQAALNSPKFVGPLPLAFSASDPNSPQFVGPLTQDQFRAADKEVLAASDSLLGRFLNAVTGAGRAVKEWLIEKFQDLKELFGFVSDDAPTALNTFKDAVRDAGDTLETSFTSATGAAAARIRQMVDTGIQEIARFNGAVTSGGGSGSGGPGYTPIFNTPNDPFGNSGGGGGGSNNGGGGGSGTDDGQVVVASISRTASNAYQPVQPVVVNFNISAVDGPSVKSMIYNQRAMIVGIIEEAYRRTGRRGPI